MNINWQLIRFPFDDERWISKAVIGGLLAFFGMLFWPLYLPLAGYAVRVMRQAIEGESPSLPEWDEWGELLADGLRFAVVLLLYTLPAWLLLCCTYAFMFLSLPLIDSMGAGLPPVAYAGSMIGFFGLFALGSLVTYPLVFLAMVAESRMVARNSLSRAFEIGEVWQLARAGFGNYFLASVVLYGFIMLANVVVVMTTYTIVLACLFPVLFAGMAFYSLVLMGALYGVAYRETRTQLAVSGVAA